MQGFQTAICSPKSHLLICSTPHTDKRSCARSLRCAGRRFWGGPGALHRFLHAAVACCMYFCIRLHVFFCSTHRYVSLVCRAGAGKVRARLRLASHCCGFATRGLPAGTPMDVWLRSRWCSEAQVTLLFAVYACMRVCAYALRSRGNR